MRIGVLMGGISAERDVSLNTGRGVFKALGDRGHEVVAIDWTQREDLAATLRRERVERAWIALHGTLGEDGCVQGLLECLRIPYTGSGVTASALAMDKVLSKRLFEAAGVPTAAWRIAGTDPDERARELGFPLVVKPACEGSTVGITVVREPRQIEEAVALARQHHGATMLEAFVPGRELSVGIIDGEVLGTVEIRTRGGFYDYDAKYLRGDNEYLVPAPIEGDVDRAVRGAARDAYFALGCRGHARVDVRLDPQGRPFVLEVNTLPGMTQTSLLPKIARHAGMDYGALCERVLAGARLG
ncbi:MAG TPA: D-alanine--D-alanine ligase [bacterium]|nr:D-alanine--D-alanine ligase [bacterium]